MTGSDEEGDEEGGTTQSVITQWSHCHRAVVASQHRNTNEIREEQ